jgi:hypothetical protein
MQQVPVEYHGFKVIKNSTGILKMHVDAFQKYQVGFYAL